MSLTITITDITNLTDTERAVLRYMLDGAPMPDELRERKTPAATADSLKATIRAIGGVPAPTPHVPVVMDDSRTFAVESITVHPPIPFPNSEHVTVSVAPTPHAPVIEEGGYFIPSDCGLNIPLAPPAAPVAPSPPAAASAELDAAGLPWDKRIHASTRTKVAAGTWKYARGVDGDYIKTVERELRAVQDIPVPDAAAAQQVVASTQALPQFESTYTDATHYEAGDKLALDGTVLTVAAPIVPLPPVPTAPMTFAQLMQHITPLLVSGKLNQPLLQQAVESCGLPHLAALGARPDLVETVRAAIDAAVGGV